MKKIRLCIFIMMILFFGRINVFAYNSYKVGEIIYYNNSRYYVIQNSNKNQNYITLLKMDFLDQYQLARYKDQDYNAVGYYFPFTIGSAYNNNYDSSSVKVVVDNWVTNELNSDDLVEIDGYKARLLSIDDLENHLGFEYRQLSPSDYGYTTDDESFIFTNKYGNSSNYWLMDSIGDDISRATIIGNCGGFGVIDYTRSRPTNLSAAAVRPVINLNKCAIEHCENDNNYKVGDLVEYNGEKYFIIEKTSDYFKLLKSSFLTADQVTRYNDRSYTSNKGEIKFTNVSNNTYNDSNVKTVVDNWSESELNIDDLVEVDGYKARLLNVNDLENNLGFHFMYVSESSQRFANDDYYFMTGDIFEDNGRRPYWIMDNFYDISDINSYIYCSFADLPCEIDYDVYNENLYVRPVINLKSSLFINENINEEEVEEEETDNISYKQKEYSFGDKVIYNGEVYYVLIKSDARNDYVTLMKETPLTKAEIEKYYDGEIRESGEYGLVNFSSTGRTFSSTNVSKILNGWAQDQFSDNLQEIDDYKVRLITTDELVDYLGFTFDAQTYIGKFSSSSDTPNWVVNDTYGYWTMTPNSDNGFLSSYINVVKNVVQGDYHGNTVLNSFSEFNAIRPIVNVSKCAIDPQGSGCTKCISKVKKFKFKDYFMVRKGLKVTYNGDEYYVLRESNTKMSYVTLIKKTPLTADEIDRYGIDSNGNNIVNNYSPDDEQNGHAFRYPSNVGGMQFYSSSTCGYIDGQEVSSGCKSTYDESKVKIVVDNWANDKFSNNILKSVGGYKARLVTLNERSFISSAADAESIGDITFWMNDIYYSDSGHLRDNTAAYIMSLDSIYPGKSYVYLDRNQSNQYPAVWPVVNVDKCVIDGKCDDVEVDLKVCMDEKGEIEDPLETIDNDIQIVEVENTYKSLHKLLIIFGIIFITIGSIFFRKNLKKQD